MRQLNKVQDSGPMIDKTHSEGSPDEERGWLRRAATEMTVRHHFHCVRFATPFDRYGVYCNQQFLIVKEAFTFNFFICVVDASALIFFPKILVIV